MAQHIQIEDEKIVDKKPVTKIFLKFSSDGKLVLEFDWGVDNITVDDLKLEIEKIMTIPMHEQKLLFQGKELSFYSGSLGSFGIQSLSTLLLKSRYFDGDDDERDIIQIGTGPYTSVLNIGDHVEVYVKDSFSAGCVLLSSGFHPNAACANSNSVMTLSSSS